MNMKLRLLAAFAVLGMTPYAMTGCGGTECGEGTTEQDGQCVAPTTGESITCADGTTLNEGKCEADISDCGDGTSLVDGACVADEGPDPSESCGSGTQYDEGVGACVPTSTIECGDGTVEQDGSCVAEPQDSTCQAGTKLADDGSCVVDMAACGDKTQLDPNSNTCLATDEVCGANTAYDADSDSCVPTDAVCDAGTVYSMETGLCLPEATCKAGDVILNGNCVSPVEEAIANADFTSQEAMDPVANNDDVLNGGTANALTVPAMGTVVVAGEIGTPVDLDGDTRPDQDVDTYTFSATAGQTLQISVQPTAGPSLAFAVVANGGLNALSQEDFFLRYAPFGFNSGASRSIVIPEDGDYTIVVAPSLYMANGFEGGPVGNDNWKYALRVEDVAPYMPTDADVTAGPIVGNFQNLSDNYFKLTNFTGGPGTLTVNSLGEDVGSPILQIQTSAGIFSTFVLDDGDEEVLILPPGDIYFFFDWQTIFGQDTGFDVSFTPLAIDEPLGAATAGTPITSTPTTLAPGGTRTFTVDVPADTVLEFSQTNDESSSISVSVSSPSGELLSQTASNGTNYYVINGQPSTLLIEATNTSTADRTNTTLTFNVITPYDMGTLAAGGSATYTEAMNIPSKARRFIKLVITEEVLLSGVLVADPSSRDPDLRVFDPRNNRLHSYATGGGEEFDLVFYQPGKYFFDILAFNELDNGLTFSLEAFAPPTPEAEPNNTIADATTLMGLPNLSEGTSARDGMDTDIFGFSITTPGVYSINTATTGASGCAVLSLHNAAGDIIEQDSGSSGLSVAAYLQATDYFFSVTGNCQGDTATFDYSTQLAAEMAPAATGDVEPNNDSTTATDGTVVPGYTAHGTVVGPTDEDWYKFTVANPASVLISKGSFAGAPAPHANMVFEFFDSTGATSLGVDAASLQAGDFFVKVSGFNDVDYVGNSYSFSIITPPSDYMSAAGLGLAIDGSQLVTNDLMVPDTCTIASLQVYLDITHVYRGDMAITLTSPTGTSNQILASAFDGTDDYLGYVPVDFSSSSTDLSVFNTENAAGTWTLSIDDTFPSSDDGTLNQWGLRVVCEF